MHSVVSTSGDRPPCQPSADHTVNHNIGRTLAAFEAHLYRTGKVCLKPWCWRRFSLLFRPGFEPPWLSSWWSIPNHEKKALFLRQLEYLAYRTNRFDAAHQFLRGLAEDNWVYGSGFGIRGPEYRRRDVA